MTPSRTLLFLLSIIITLASCKGKRSTTQTGLAGDTIQLKYAQLLHIVKHDGYTIVSIDNPWKEGKTLHNYVIVNKDAPLPSPMPEGTLVRVPTEKNIVFNTSHCQLMGWLGAESQLAGVADLKYILVPFVKEGVAEGRIADCGNGMSPIIEKIVDLKPDLLMLSPFENSGGYGRLEGIGIPLLECADYMEHSALARAEWMKFYGLLLGKERQADSLFHLVDSCYHALKSTAQKANGSPFIITEKLTGSTWYVPGGKSTVSGIISDANGKYAWSNDTHAGSLPMTFETVLDKAGGADVWIFNHFGSGRLTYEQLASEYSGYKEMKAFKQHHTWYVDTQSVPYFEEVPFRPDFLLRDYITLLHPELGLGSPKYYSPVVE